MEIQSSASSVINLDLDNNSGNRILVQDVEAEVDSIDEDVYQVKPSDESKQGESKKLLRDQLRRTLTSNHVIAEPSSKNRGSAHLLPDARKSSNYHRPREYFILTDAGKPVFISRGTNTDDRDISSMLGIMQALISVFIDDGDKLKSINAGKTRITFLQRPPLYYACVSTWGEPESVTRSQLEYLHLQIISVITSAQLKRIFERRGNFDLRRLLGGADTFLTTMIARLQLDLAISMSALRCLRLDPLLRTKLAQALVPSGKITKVCDILYVILVAQSEIITLIRPKKHSVHPADIHILLTTLASPSLSNSPASAMWVPLCLPKWNEGRMVNAYVVNIPYISGVQPTAQHDNVGNAEATIGKGNEAHTSSSNPPSLTLVCISGGSDFDSVRAWCDQASASSSSLHHLRTHIFHSSYTASELGIPGLRHFVYKAKGLVQVTYPIWEDDLYREQDIGGNNFEERKRIITLYQLVHDAIHAKGMSTLEKGEAKEGLKLQYLKTDTEAVLGWMTQPFEIYLTLSPLLPKSAAVGAANAVARWVKKEENKLFLKDAPVF
ncbi:trafficking protein Mon1-domain-containing protein [Lentinula raphanica]|nr:trafficking protein Mon1-domain-containing protein [Lentinula raphanica]